MRRNEPKRRRLSDAEVAAVRHAKRCGEQQKAIALRFGVSQSSVSLIVRGLRRGHA